MRHAGWALAALCALITAAVFTPAHAEQDVLFQVSTYNILEKGIYEGDVTFKEIKARGDFALGTLNAVDGELIGLDGAFYQIKTDGLAYAIDEGMKTPFAMVTHFVPDRSVAVADLPDYGRLKQHLDGVLESTNLFYAFKIEGTFKSVTVRSVPAQERPYPPLSELFKVQSIFTLKDVKGTVIGFRSPVFFKGIDVPGYHCHFITEDRRQGGHVLECSLEKGRAHIDALKALHVVFPESEEFRKLATIE